MELSVPGDKSITHRALLLAALCTGGGRVRGALAAADTRSTAAVLRSLGADVSELHDSEVRVTGRGLRGFRAPPGDLDCGNSGTTARLLLGILSAQPLEATLDGDPSLRGRPMRRVTGPLGTMGARIEELGSPDRLPLRVRGGPLQGIEHASVQASAQVKSALLLAGLCAGVPVAVTEPYPSRDHTERLLAALDLPLAIARVAAGHRVALEPAGAPREVDVTVPGDFSSAAFLLGAAILLGRHDVILPGVGVNPTRTGLLGVLGRMGADVAMAEVTEMGGEPRAHLQARPGPLRGTHVGAAEVPALIDELPLVAVLAARAEGETVVTGAAELRVKETDRIGALVENLRAVGVAAEELADGFAVQGTDAPLQGRVRTHGDHRIAMAFGVLGALPGCAIDIDQPDCVAVSFPGFPALLARMREEA